MIFIKDIEKLTNDELHNFLYEKMYEEAEIKIDMEKMQERKEELGKEIKKIILVMMRREDNE